jgi:hypothetical protein
MSYGRPGASLGNTRSCMTIWPPIGTRRTASAGAKRKSGPFFGCCHESIRCLPEQSRLPGLSGAGQSLSVLDDGQAATLGLVKVIDESGEAYLYPSLLFAMIAVPQAIAERLAA